MKTVNIWSICIVLATVIALIKATAAAEDSNNKEIAETAPLEDDVDKRAFYHWKGKRAFYAWKGKRAFYAWKGKRDGQNSDIGQKGDNDDDDLSDDIVERAIGGSAKKNNGQYYQLEGKKRFYPWAGKRAFYAWKGKRGANMDKRAFYAWKG